MILGKGAARSNFYLREENKSKAASQNLLDAQEAGGGGVGQTRLVECTFAKCIMGFTKWGGKKGKEHALGIVGKDQSPRIGKD